TGLVAVAGVVVLLGNAFGLFGRSTPGASTGCVAGPAVRFGHEGAVAYVKGDSLHLLEFQSRRDRVLVAHGVHRPVRWSWDGTWIAFQDADGTVAVVPAGGGPACQPLGGNVQAWAWSPVRTYLVGVTAGGGLVRGGPDQKPKFLLPNGWGVSGSPSFDSSGKSVAVQAEHPSPGAAGVFVNIWTIEVRTARPHEVFRVPANIATDMAVAGWSSDGSWVLFWAGSRRLGGFDELPLEAVRLSGEQPVQIVSAMLVHTELLTWCGNRLVVVAGGGREITLQKKLVIAQPPDWSAVPVSSQLGSTQSAFWPSCSSPFGKLVAASVGPSRSSVSPLDTRWALWLVQPQGSIGGPTTDPGPGFSDEAPRWSRDGTSVLFVRRAVGTTNGQLYVLTPTSPGQGLGKVTGPIADLASYPDTDGYIPWSGGFDWYQPRGNR
ncbi:MAG TPA: hypothetical protein VF972_04900, partial [Actinomycetota bacterium]